MTQRRVSGTLCIQTRDAAYTLRLRSVHAIAADTARLRVLIYTPRAEDNRIEIAFEESEREAFETGLAGIGERLLAEGDWHALATAEGTVTTWFNAALVEVAVLHTPADTGALTLAIDSQPLWFQRNERAYAPEALRELYAALSRAMKHETVRLAPSVTRMPLYNAKHVVRDGEEQDPAAKEPPEPVQPTETPTEAAPPPPPPPPKRASPSLSSEGEVYVPKPPAARFKRQRRARSRVVEDE